MVGRMRLIKWLVVFVLSSILASWCLMGTALSAGPELAAIPAAPARPGKSVVLMVDTVFVLTVVEDEGRLAYLGLSENIENQLNPDLMVKKGDIVELVLLNTMEGAVDVCLLGYDVSSPVLWSEGMGASMVFDAWDAGDFVYCSRFPDLARRGLQGRFLVQESTESLEVAPALTKR